MNILSIEDIIALLREQADMRATENDESGFLRDAADALDRSKVAELTRAATYTGVTRRDIYTSVDRNTRTYTGTPDGRTIPVDEAS